MVSNTPPVGNWLLCVILALRNAGGTAGFQRIYRWIEMNRRALPDTWEETVRATVNYHSSDSPAFKKGSPDVFVKKGRGLWALRNPSGTVFGKNYQRLRLQAIQSMTDDELESLSGKSPDVFHAYVDQQIEEKKRKIKIE